MLLFVLDSVSVFVAEGVNGSVSDAAGFSAGFL
jgi:hypothetical protein